jgi:hypothetical protein
MGNTTVTPGGDYERIYAYAYRAEWQFRDAVASTDPNADAFGPPPWSQRQGLLRQPVNPYAGYDPSRGRYSKPVTYLPVKRRNGQDQFPTVIISIQLFSPQRTQNGQVKIWTGTTVEVDVVNVLASQKGSPEAKVTLSGKLDTNLSCKIEVKPPDVKAWLKDGSALKALVNENLLDFRFKLNGVNDGGQPVVGQSQDRLFLYCRKTAVFLPGLFGSQIHFTAADGSTIGYPMFSDTFWQSIGALECDEQGVPLIPHPTTSLLMLRGFRFIASRVIDPFSAYHEARITVLPHVPPQFRLYTLIIYPYDWRADLTDAAAQLNQNLFQLQNAPSGLKQAPDTDDQVAVMGHSTGGVVIRRALGRITDQDCLDPAVKGNHPVPDTLISLAFFLSVPFDGAPKALPVLMTGLQEPEGSRMIPFLVPESLVAVSLAMPIVYHLATTGDYAYRPASSPSRPAGAQEDREADKAGFVTDALDAGLMPRPWFVRASVTDPALRRRLALGANDWHQLVRELAQRTNGLSVVEATNGSYAVTRWFTSEVERRGLKYQQDARQPGGWNAALANRAKSFHQSSTQAITDPWNQRSCIVWGISSDAGTFRQINLSKGAPITHHGGVLGVFRDRGQTVNSGLDSTSAATITAVAADPLVGGIKTYSQWEVQGDTVIETPWTLRWISQKGAGDGTVPADSQLAEIDNVAAVVLTGPQGMVPHHMESTRPACVWEALVMAMHKIDRNLGVTPVPSSVLSFAGP